MKHLSRGELGHFSTTGMGACDEQRWRRGWRRMLCLACMAVACCWPFGHSHADGLHSVDVTLVGVLGREPTLPERISSWFDPGLTRVRVTSRQRLDTNQVLSPEPNGVVYVWAVLDKSNEARLYFATASPNAKPLYSLRVVRLDGGLDDVGAERLSQVIHWSTLALLEGQGEARREQVARMLEEEVEVAAPPRPVVAPAAPKATPESSSSSTKRQPSQSGGATALELGFGYAASYRSDEGWWHGPRLSLLLPLGQRWQLGGSLQGYVPQVRDVGTIRMRLWGMAAQLGAGVRLPLTDSWRLALLVSPAVEWVGYEPQRGLNPRVTAGEGAREWRPQVGLEAELVWQGGIELALLLRGAYALSSTTYTLRTASGPPRAIAAPSPWLPTVGVELRF